ncbi:MAG: hypothetical protein U1C97_03015 [Candidatus Gracilibacteria bacterium]|nr:hypothetical protein [bacterium]MDZ4217263.1 hypothetical protein [Candidatus Gracilibacteria bacterium]
MLNEPHYPSKWTVVMVFFIILLTISGIFVWVFFLNKGTIILQSDIGFVVELEGERIACETGQCQMKLTPQVYEAVASTDGYYDESFSFEVHRFVEDWKTLRFELIPYLKTITVTELPSETLGLLDLRENGDLYFQDALLTSFESLSDPILRSSSNQAVLIDQGRVFFVDLQTGRKIRRFDDTVMVQDVKISDDGKRVLLFVDLQGVPFIWLWMNETNELIPLSWYESPDRVQWELGQNYRVFVLSSQLNDESRTSQIDELIDSVNTDKKSLALYRFNLDTEKAQQVAEFPEKIPSALQRRNQQYFVQMDNELYQELVVQ